MVENPPSTPSSSSSSSSTTTKSVDHQRRSSRRDKVIEDSGELIECSGQSCSSCTATVVADCIAVCCCPCAIANLVILTFVKVPWMMGRKCLRFMKKKKKKRRLLSRKGKKKKEESNGGMVLERDGNLRKEEGVVKEREGNLIGCEEGEEEEEEELSENFCASYEAERVWLELYQLGHLGFGRVSFSGVPEKIN